MIIPNTMPATTSPKMTVFILTGKESSLSKVPACFSQGVTRGPTEEDVKNSDIPKNPGKNNSRSNLRPR